MRNYTVYGGQGMTGAPNTGHSEFMVRRPLPEAAPKRGEWHYHHGRQNWVWVDTH
jgi:hypothetical protein